MKGFLVADSTIDGNSGGRYFIFIDISEISHLLVSTHGNT